MNFAMTEIRKPKSNDNQRRSCCNFNYSRDRSKRRSYKTAAVLNTIWKFEPNNWLIYENKIKMHLVWYPSKVLVSRISKMGSAEILQKNKQKASEVLVVGQNFKSEGKTSKIGQFYDIYCRYILNHFFLLPLKREVTLIAGAIFSEQNQ